MRKRKEPELPKKKSAIDIAFDQLRAGINRELDQFFRTLKNDRIQTAFSKALFPNGTTIEPKAILAVARTTSTEEEKLNAGMDKIMAAILQGGERGATKRMITLKSALKSSTRDLYMRTLSRWGMIFELDGGCWGLTEKGESMIVGGVFKGKELREYWIDRLPEGQSLILHTVVTRHPDWVHVDEISEQVELKSSTRDLYVRALVKWGLIDRDHGRVRAANELFEKGEG